MWMGEGAWRRLSAQSTLAALGGRESVARFPRASLSATVITWPKQLQPVWISRPPRSTERAGIGNPSTSPGLTNIGLGMAVLVVASFSAVGANLSDSLGALPWWGHVLTLTVIVLFVHTAVRLPVSFWAGHLHEHRFGLSTQSPSGWFVDRLKGFAVGSVLTAGGLLALVWIARTLPEAWPIVAASCAALLVVLGGFIAPVALEPIFHRFEPLKDSDLDRDIRALAEDAGVPVRNVLVANTSRRTRRANAYVSGLGRTRRVVFFDTLIAQSRPGEIKLVAAHELAHRRERHVAKGTALGALGAAVLILILWALTNSEALSDAIDASGVADPGIVPFFLLLASLLELLSLPFGSALSRRWERAADRISLELTGDVEAFVSAHRDLALSNLSDLDPPRGLFLLLFTHPTPPKRIGNARRWLAARS